MKTLSHEGVPRAMKQAFIAFFSLLIIFSGCKKGDDGPAGATGATGATGAQGPVGPAGADGSVMLSGAGAPAATLGKAGDFYLNKTNSDLYGPKTAAGWGTPFNLRGNANVKSGTFTLTNTDYVNGYWSVTTGGGSALGVASRTAVKNIPGITTAIFNTGTVLVYLNVPQGLNGTPSAWSELPFSIRGFNVGYMTSIRSSYDVGKLHVFYMLEQTDAAFVGLPNIFNMVVPDYTFKYVLIAGDADARKNTTGPDYSDYEAVRRYYRLAE